MTTLRPNRSIGFQVIARAILNGHDLGGQAETGGLRCTASGSAE